MVTPRPDVGTSLVELLVTVALVATVTGLGTPVVVHARDTYSGRHAATVVAGQLRAARQQAVLTGRHTAVVFDRIGDVWGFRTCVDGDNDGVSRGDIAAGVDPCREPGQPLSAWVPHTVIADITLGATRLVSFGPLGTSSSGSIVIASPRGRQFVVRVAGVTGRVRWEAA